MVILAACGILMSGLGVSAQTATPVLALSTEELSYVSVPLRTSALNTGVVDYLVQEMKKMRSPIDISRYQIPVDDLGGLIDYLMCSKPELFFVDWYNVRYSHGNGKVASLFFEYTMTPVQYAVASAEYEARVAAVLGRIPADFSDLEKLLFLHDYIADWCTYDETLTIRDAYSMLTGRTGVCQAYMLLYADLLNRIGIENTYAETTSHVWNVVKLNGEYYHIDITFDDPVGARIVSHDYFLVSTDQLYEADVQNKAVGSHLDWASPVVSEEDCASTEYDSGYVWQNCKNPFYELGGRLYFAQAARTGGMYTLGIMQAGRDLKTAQCTATSPETVWSADGSMVWQDYFSGFFLLGDTFYGNTDDSLWYCRVGEDGCETGIVKQFASSTDFYGSYTDGNGHIVLLTGASPMAVTQAVVLDAPTLATSDGSWPSALVCTRRLLLGASQSELHMGLLDMNGDNLVDITDLVRMKKRVSEAA